MAFEFEPLAIADVLLVRATRHGDQRGWFTETYKASAFQARGIGSFVQDNHSYSATRGTLRGLHFQRPPHAQGKLVRCIAGAIFDVAVDLRKNSPTLGRWVGVELRATESAMLWIPIGFAHGFQVLEPETHVFYKTTAEYDPSAEAGIRWDDSNLALKWPIAEPIVSARDAALPPWDVSMTPFSR